jgi:uncharacterized membrane protein YqjE
MSDNERSVARVLQDIVGDVQDIVRSEVALAKTEIREGLIKTRAAALLMAIGALGAVYCIAFLMLGILYSLTPIMPAWAAAFCVATGAGVLTGVFILAGMKRLKAISVAVPKTVASVKENVEWAKQQVK